MSTAKKVQVTTAEEGNAHSKFASYSDLFERLLDSTFLVDKESLKILQANPAAERVMERGANELVGRHVVELIDDADHPEAEKFFRRAMRKYYPSQLICNWQSSQGKKYVMEMMACGLALQNGDEVLQVIARDITYQSEIEKKLTELSITDELTKLANVRHFKNTAQNEHERCVRYNRNYTVILMDVDNFKHFNDTNGHPAGDALLRELAQVLKKCARTSDLVARYGGEEFVVLCHESTAHDAAILANRICENVRKYKFLHGEKQPLGYMSVSVGLASFPLAGATLEQVIESADKALYESKHAGRDRYTIAKPVAPKDTDSGESQAS